MSKKKNISKKQKWKSKPPAKSEKESSFLVYFLLLIIISFFVYECINQNQIQDDAFISFRYVINFVEGNGLVFNPGERVEGYTSIIWILLLSVLKIVGSDLVKSAQVLSVLFGVLVIVITFLLSNLVNTQLFAKRFIQFTESKRYIPLFALIPAFFLSLTGSFRYWAVSGMETTFFIFTAAFGVYIYLYEISSKKNHYFSFIVFTISLLIRQEALIFIFITFLHKIFLSLKNNKSEKSKEIILKELAFPVAIVASVIILLTVFRLIYYGYPLPNTFYAKTGFTLDYLNIGLEYFFDFVQSYMLFGFVLLLPVILYQNLRSIILYFYSLIISYTIYVIVIGGDVLPFHRFFLPLLPVIFVLSAGALYFLFLYLRMKFSFWKKVVIVVPIFTLVYGYYLYFPLKDRIESLRIREISLVNKMSEAGIWFSKKQVEAKKNLVVVASTIGALSYYSGVKVVDMLGLTDKNIAHNPNPIEFISSEEVGWKERKYNADYIMSLKPDYIIFSTDLKPSAYAERALFTLDEFLLGYYHYYVIIKSKLLYVYKRKPENVINELLKNNLINNEKYDYNFINLFIQLFGEKDENTVINKSNKIIEIGPAYFSPPYHILGQMYEKKRQHEKAIEYYYKALEIDEFNFVGRLNLANYFRKNNDTLNMNMHLLKIEEYFPDYFKYLFMQAR